MVCEANEHGDLGSETTEGQRPVCCVVTGLRWIRSSVSRVRLNTESSGRGREHYQWSSVWNEFTVLLGVECGGDFEFS